MSISLWESKKKKKQKKKKKKTNLSFIIQDKATKL